MDVGAFAESQRLKVRRDEDGTQIIPGKAGHVWAYGAGRLAVTLLELTPRTWGHRKRACLAVGMDLHQDGDYEGTLLFDPTDAEQVQVALKAAHVKRRRRVSTKTKERLRAMSARRQRRINAPQEGTLTDSNARTVLDAGSGKGSELAQEKTLEGRRRKHGGRRTGRPDSPTDVTMGQRART
jgi:hypothetical protein